MKMDQNEAKLQAARAAIALLPESGTLGLGSGSTSKLFVDEVGARVRAGAKYRGVPTSQSTRAQALALGIPLIDDDVAWDIVLAVDGADEVDDHLNLIKGGGGALTREKIVNHAAKKNVIIVDDSKLSRRLGEKWAIPVEVLAFGVEQTRRYLAELGRTTRREKDGKVFVTDAGNAIFDVAVGPMDDPSIIDRAMRSIPGVVETGLFLGRADVVIVAGPSGIRTLTR